MEGLMEDCVVRLIKRIGYLSIIFTFMAVLLGVGFGIDLGSTGAQNVYAAGPQPAEAVSASVVGATKPEDTGKHGITREQATEMILAAKKAKGLTWEQLAKDIGGGKVWVTSALLGQNSMSKEQADKAVKLLGLGPDVASVLTEYPMKGSLDKTVPVDPLIYRFHEITQVYGTTMKEVIQEMFGDGIMSAIDFEIEIQKKPDPKGDRVIIIYNGKFLPYKKW
jgi:cyanate lyase